MISFWRIYSKRHSKNAFSGKGAEITGGRWNPVGIPMTYTAENLSLAALELFVHVSEEEEPADLIAAKATLPIEVEALDQLKERTPRDMAEDWQYRMDWSRNFGSEWIRGAKSLVLPVPSTIIPEEWNLLLNPTHPDSVKLRITGSRAFRFDKRMFKDRGLR